MNGFDLRRSACGPVGAERLIPDDPAHAVPVLLSDLNMLVFTGGQERTNAEYGQLLAEAGLNLARVQPVTSPLRCHRGACAMSRPSAYRARREEPGF
jgi:hypothetical protein